MMNIKKPNGVVSEKLGFCYAGEQYYKLNILTNRSKAFFLSRT